METIILIVATVVVFLAGITIPVALLQKGYHQMATFAFFLTMVAAIFLFFITRNYEENYIENYMESSTISSTFSENELTDMDKVDEELRKFLSSMGPDDPIEIRKESAEKVFERLVEQGLIKEYQYDETSKLFTFAYTNGVLGGLRIGDFSEDVNGTKEALRTNTNKETSMEE